MPSTTITDYEVLFGLRTGLTIMLPKQKAFDHAKSFTLSKENPSDVVIDSLVIKGLQKNHIDDAVKRGFIMFYETEDDEVVRNSLCSYQKS